MSRKDKTPSSPLSGNTGILAGIIIIIVILGIIAMLLATGNAASGNTGISAPVPPNECGAAVVGYANANLISKDSPATLVSVTDRNGMYQVTAQNQARTFGFYATKDCTFLFIDPYNLKANYTPKPTTVVATTAPTPVALPVKSARPSTELFVMSFCPFGVQAESAIDPVVDLLGSKADFKVRYIATVSGDNLEAVKSLHGLAEAKEDLRQLCVAKSNPDKFWDYVKLVNDQCYPIYKNASQLATCQANVTATLGIDNQKIDICATGSEGLALLKADEAITTNLKVTGSPTLFMNGQKYAGQRTAEAYKQAICARFETAPVECSVNLSGQATAASSGSC